MNDGLSDEGEEPILRLALECLDADEEEAAPATDEVEVVPTEGAKLTDPTLFMDEPAPVVDP